MMTLFHKILHFFKGLQKPSPQGEEDSSERKKSLFQKPFQGKRPAGFKMPKWAQKDYFQQKKMGTMVPPEELAEEASLRRPGDWLRKKLSGSDKAQEFEKIEKTKQTSGQGVGMSDQEIDSFLGKVLDKKRPKPKEK